VRWFCNTFFFFLTFNKQISIIIIIYLLLTGVRRELNKHDFKSLFTVVKERHYSNTEIQELADIAYRNLTLEQGFAMDPLIEKCLIGM